jgi:putative transposase
MTKYNPKKHHRRSIRLKGYDYTRPGAYFVTICTYQRQALFGEVIDGEMVLNACGKIVREEWLKTTQIRTNIQLHQDEFVVMPNHPHGIIWIDKTVGARRRRAPTKEGFGKPVKGSIPTIVRAYKSAVTLRINQILNSSGAPFWQRNYYERVVRNNDELNAIRQYIRNNPQKWELDQDNPVNLMPDNEEHQEMPNG